MWSKQDTVSSADCFPDCLLRCGEIGQGLGSSLQNVIWSTSAPKKAQRSSFSTQVPLLLKCLLVNDKACLLFCFGRPYTGFNNPKVISGGVITWENNSVYCICSFKNALVNRDFTFLMILPYNAVFIHGVIWAVHSPWWVLSSLLYRELATYCYVLKWNWGTGQSDLLNVLR